MVALVVIGIVVLALGYIHLSSGDDAVSVPAGAKAGDLRLDDCRYATEQGSYDADCGTLVVPENRHDPDSRLIALPITRIHAHAAHPASRSSGSRAAPAVTNMDVPGREPVHRPPRRRARRLPRRRRLRHASTVPR